MHMNTQKKKTRPSSEDLMVKQLEDQLYALQKPTLQLKTKEKLKQHLFNRLSQNPGEVLPFSLAHLASQLRVIGRKVLIPQWVFDAMRVRIKEYIQEHARIPWYRRIWNGFTGFGLQKIASGFLLGVFVVTIFFSFQLFSPNLTYAAPLVYVEEIEGDVKILREQRVLEATETMELKEGDVVLTKEASSATLHFFDDTVSRLDENTSLTLQRISAKPTLPNTGVVEVFLQEGRLWTEALPWFEESRFTVETPTVSANVDKKALFDMKVTTDTTEIAVAESMVEIVSKTEPYTIPKTLVAGYKLSTNTEAPSSFAVEKWEKKPEKNTQDQWLNKNIKRATEVPVSQEEKPVIKPLESPLTAGENDNPVVRELHQEFNKAIEIFREAEQLLKDNQVDASMKRFEDFNVAFAGVVVQLRSFEDQDALRAATIRKLFNDNLTLYLKKFRGFYPDNNMYEAKKILQGAQLMLASNETERIHQQFMQATTILLEVEDLFSKDKRSVAGVLLKRYRVIMDEILATNTFDFQQDKNAIEFIQNLVEHIKHLTALEQQLLDNTEYASIRIQLQKSRQDLLRKFIINAELIPRGIPDHLLYEVKDLYDTYANEQTNERDLLDPAVKKIAEKDYEVAFIKPLEISSTQDKSDSNVDQSHESPLQDDTVIDREIDNTAEENSNSTTPVVETPTEEDGLTPQEEVLNPQEEPTQNNVNPPLTPDSAKPDEITTPAPVNDSGQSNDSSVRPSSPETPENPHSDAAQEENPPVGGKDDGSAIMNRSGA